MATITNNDVSISKKFNTSSINDMPAEPCVVEIKRPNAKHDNYAVLVTNEQTGNETSFNLMPIPNDTDLQHMIISIHTCIKSLYPNLNENKVIALARTISNWCSADIGHDMTVLLNREQTPTEHHYIKFMFIGKKRRDLQYHGFIQVLLYKDGAEVAQLNSKQLVKWLTDNPDTPIYQAGYAEEAERDLIAETITLSQQIEVSKVTALMTTAQRFKTKLERYSGGKLVFGKKGIKWPSKAELARTTF